MNEDTTKILATSGKTVSHDSTPETSECTSPIKSDCTSPSEPSRTKKETKDKVVYGTSGFVAGAVSGASAASVYGKSTGDIDTDDEVEDVQEQVQSTEPDALPSELEPTEPAPAEHEAILATDEGVRVAQVDDEQSFSDAFANARGQVGPGGVFEWRGKVYGTYYESEWASMSSEERAEYQSKIDYKDVMDSGQEAPSSTNYSGHSSGMSSSDSGSYTTSSYATTGSSSPVDDSESQHGFVEVEINGETVHAQEVTIDGHAALLVDTDNDGQIEVVLEDTNFDGQVDLIQADTNEDGVADTVMADIDGDGTPDVVAYDVNGDGYISDDEISAYDPVMECDDDLPDYMNDADPSLYTV